LPEARSFFRIRIRNAWNASAFVGFASKTNLTKFAVLSHRSATLCCQVFQHMRNDDLDMLAAKKAKPEPVRVQDARAECAPAPATDA